MTRAVLLAALALVASCSPAAPQPCPGEEVGRFSFEGTLATAPLADGLDPEPTMPDCPAALAFPPTLAFEGTVAGDATTSSGAICRSTGLVLLGILDGARWTVETSTDGAVLGACGSTCAAQSLVVITGDVLPDTTSPSEFRGALVEQLTASEGSCDACVLPCEARYDLLGTVEAAE